MHRIYTIGHSNHEMDEFIQLLIKHSITAICDVRSTPYSKYTSQFNYEFIKHDLKKAGIQYVYLGKELGPRSDEPSCYINGKVQYGLLAKTNMFKECDLPSNYPSVQASQKRGFSNQSHLGRR